MLSGKLSRRAAIASRPRLCAASKGKWAEAPERRQIIAPDVVRRLLHGLRVHQAELELQNEKLRHAQLALDDERARYCDLYDLAPVGYCTLSEQGLILEVNLTAAKLLGVARSDLIQQAFSRFVVHEDQDIYHQHRDKLVDSGLTQWCELRMKAHDGTPFWAHLEASIARNADGASLHRVVLSNISERKLLDRSLEERNLELENARKVAEMANRAKSDFLSSMSHELRSPLNSVLGFAQLLESSTPAPTSTQQSRIDQILRGGWYLLTLVNEILDLSLIESGQNALSLEPLSLTEVLLDCQRMIEPQVQTSGIDVSFAQFTSPFLVIADAVRLKQLIVNLLTNAIKYNHPGGTVDVTIDDTIPEVLRVNVRDTGQGLSPEKLSHLFEPFNRLGQEGGMIEGTGLGLVVAKRLTEMMGGKIGVQSTVDVGSVFWVDLTRTQAQRADAEQVHVDRDPANAALNQSPCIVMYVEDNPANMELVEQILAARPNIQLLRASNGIQGIEMARAHLPRVILMDINLPGLSGVEVLKILRQDPLTKHIPVLAISANAMSEHILKGLSAGFFQYLTKPFKVKEFLKVLDSAMAFARTQSPMAIEVP
ncbi:MAG: ATP-binding protein [Rhodoferax sp.]|uniref:PAS domain-containing hybrid sensor histidine kinase/response regulator n=1 Tax=Rhodoferax sp. TaxID=50421 RepID=UPI00273577FF|nr:ATP-binding protein [Rhodoferax sp.]MDP3336765.1 ATP-binding protein [Rhodoferax sp.]